MNLIPTAKGAVAAVFIALLACAGGSTAALAQGQESSPLHAACTDENGSLFRIDNFDEREYDFTLREAGEGGTLDMTYSE